MKLVPLLTKIQSKNSLAQAETKPFGKISDRFESFLWEKVSSKGLLNTVLSAQIPFTAVENKSKDVKAVSDKQETISIKSKTSKKHIEQIVESKAEFNTANTAQIPVIPVFPRVSPEIKAEPAIKKGEIKFTQAVLTPNEKPQTSFAVSQAKAEAKLTTSTKAGLTDGLTPVKTNEKGGAKDTIQQLAVPKSSNTRYSNQATTQKSDLLLKPNYEKTHTSTEKSIETLSQKNIPNVLNTTPVNVKTASTELITPQITTHNAPIVSQRINDKVYLSQAITQVPPIFQQVREEVIAKKPDLLFTKLNNPADHTKHVNNTSLSSGKTEIASIPAQIKERASSKEKEAQVNKPENAIQPQQNAPKAAQLKSKQFWGMSVSRESVVKTNSIPESNASIIQNKQNISQEKAVVTTLIQKDSAVIMTDDKMSSKEVIKPLISEKPLQGHTSTDKAAVHPLNHTRSKERQVVTEEKKSISETIVLPLSQFNKDAQFVANEVEHIGVELKPQILQTEAPLSEKPLTSPVKSVHTTTAAKNLQENTVANNFAMPDIKKSVDPVKPTEPQNHKSNVVFGDVAPAQTQSNLTAENSLKAIPTMTIPSRVDNPLEKESVKPVQIEKSSEQSTRVAAEQTEPQKQVVQGKPAENTFSDSLLMRKMTVEQIREIQKMVSHAADKINALTPNFSETTFNWNTPEFGKLKFTVGADKSGEVAIEITSDRSEVADMLDKSKQVLERVFMEQGIRVERYEVNFKSHENFETNRDDLQKRQRQAERQALFSSRNWTENSAANLHETREPIARNNMPTFGKRVWVA